MSELQYLLQQSNDITTALVASGGEVTEELERALMIRDIRLPAAVDRAAMLMARLEHEEAYWDALSAKYAAIAKGCGKARERLKDSIKSGMNQLGEKELVGDDVRLVLTRVKPKLHYDSNLLDPNYLKTKQVTEPDKDKIRKDLEQGLEVEGAFLEESYAIRPYPNTKGDRK